MSVKNVFETSVILFMLLGSLDKLQETSAQVARLGYTAVVRSSIIAPCVNIDPTCRERAQNGECTAPSFVKDMLVNCPVSCDSCLPTDKNDCVANKGDDISCELGRMVGMCISAPTYHLRKCARSCRQYIEVCVNATKPLEDVPCAGPKTLKLPDFGCGNQEIDDSNRNSRRLRFRSQGSQQSNRKKKRINQKLPDPSSLPTRPKAETFKLFKEDELVSKLDRNMPEKPNTVPMDTLRERKEEISVPPKSSRQQDISDYLDNAVIVPQPGIREVLLADYDYEEYHEFRLIRTVALLAATTVSLSVGAASAGVSGGGSGGGQGGESSQGSSNAQQQSAQQQQQQSGQASSANAQVQSQSGGSGGQSQGGVSFTQNTGAQGSFGQGTGSGAGTGGLSTGAVIAGPIVAATSAAAAISVAFVAAVTRQAAQERPRSSFDRGTADEYVVPEPRITRTIVPHCNMTGYRELRQQLSDISDIDNGLPLGDEGLQLFRAIRFCKYGVGNFPSGLDNIATFDNTDIDITPPDSFIGISTPIRQRETSNDNDLPQKRKRSTREHQEIDETDHNAQNNRVLYISTEHGIGSVVRPNIKRAVPVSKSKKPVKIIKHKTQHINKQRTNVNDKENTREGRFVLSLLNKVWSKFNGETKYSDKSRLNENNLLNKRTIESTSYNNHHQYSEIKPNTNNYPSNPPTHYYDDVNRPTHSQHSSNYQHHTKQSTQYKHPSNYQPTSYQHPSNYQPTSYQHPSNYQPTSYQQQTHYQDTTIRSTHYNPSNNYQSQLPIKQLPEFQPQPPTRQPTTFQEAFMSMFGRNATRPTVRPPLDLYYDIPVIPLPKINASSSLETTTTTLKPKIQPLDDVVSESPQNETVIDDGGVIIEDILETIEEVEEEEVEEEVIERYFCGGAMVTNLHLLTAAHCIQIPQPDTIQLGQLGQEMMLEIDDIFIHPDYREQFKEHDIALIQLAEPVPDDGILQPYCVPTVQETFEGEVAIVSGWGTRPNRRQSEILQNTSVIVRNSEECSQNYTDALQVAFTDEYPSGITDAMLCANGDHGEDACQGDSGGPLSLDRDAKLNVIGIVSSGYGCSNRDTPGIYSRVNAYQDWLDFMIYGQCSSFNFGNDSAVNSNITTDSINDNNNTTSEMRDNIDQTLADIISLLSS